MDERARSEWQRRYDKSVEAERAASRNRDPFEDEDAAIQTAGCLPSWLGLVAVGVTTLVVLTRRWLRRT